jgi:arylsulfatase A
MVGKWHLGLDWARTGPGTTDLDYTKPFGGGPTAHGFDWFYGIIASLDMPPYLYLENDRAVSEPTGTIGDSPKPPMWRAGPISPDFHHDEVLSRFTEKSIAYIKAQSAAKGTKPFFLYLALASPHTPILPTSTFPGSSRTNAYGDFVLETDAAIGKILDALDELGLAKNTLVIFTADNGCAPVANLEELKVFQHDPSAGFRGHKADIYEGGHRVPFIARWPGHTPAGARDAHLVGQLDLLATCADLLGVTLPESAGEDSVSMMPLLRGEKAASGLRVSLVNHSENGSFAIRQGQWKLALCPGSGGWSYPHPEKDDTIAMPKYQLFDLDSDPAERTNLVNEHPEIVERLGRLMRDYIEQGRSTPGTPQPYDRSADWPQTGWMTDFADAHAR